MLNPLIVTDILNDQPDIRDLDILSPERMSWLGIPPAPGCYAFYEADTGKVVYIGSAGASGVSAHDCGLRMRLCCYRSQGAGTTVMRVREYHKIKPLLVQLWVSATVGDARKYEDDAIRRHKPCLNVIGVVERTQEEKTAILRARQVASNTRMEAYLATADLPSAVRCPVCEQTKPREDFSPSYRRKSGVHRECRACRRAINLKKSGGISHAERRAINAQLAEKRCYRCEETKPVSEFHNSIRGRGGYANYCKPCAITKCAEGRARKLQREGPKPRRRGTPEHKALRQALSSKPFAFVDPNGVEHRGTNISEFALLRGLSPSHMCKLQRGINKKYRGWTAVAETKQKMKSIK